MTDDTLTIPAHVGFIMDGNRRWAKARGLPTYKGHLAGYEAARRVSEACFKQGIRFVTLYAFSTENWRRDKNEVAYILKLLMRFLSDKELSYAIEKGLRLLFLGSRKGLDSKLLAALEKAEEATKNLTKGTLCICFNYGGQQEVADAARKCLEDDLTAEQITPEAISARLYQPDVPPVDLVVRTSGEQRLSNFMLWRVEYSELLFLKKHWPEMTNDDVDAIIKTYDQRSRRFGG